MSLNPAESLVLLSEYCNCTKKMLTFFKGANIHLLENNKPRRSVPVTILTNGKLLYATFVFVCFVVLMTTQTTGHQDTDVLVLQIWSAAAVFQLVTRGINGVVHLDSMNNLLTWYQKVYEPTENTECQAVIDEFLRKQNYYIKSVMKFIPAITICAGINYIGQPIFTRTRTLPTPMVWNGVPETEFSLPMYLLIYVGLMYSTYNVVLSIMASDCFFPISAVILGNRLKTIGGLLMLLNYSGERDRKKDQELIRYCYLMHLEVMQKVTTFQNYFNLYGLFHFMSPILINTMLSYFLNKNGFNLMTVTVIVAMSFQIGLVCFFGEVLSGFADAFSESIYQLDWYNFSIGEKKMLLLMYMRSQEAVSIKAGHLYEVNFPTLTQVFKFQASFYAVLKTI